RLHQLLVEVRCVDLGQQLSGLDACPDVDLPVLQVATYARIDGRARVSFQSTRQIEIRAQLLAAWRCHRHGRKRLRFGPIAQTRAAAFARENAGSDDGNGHCRCKEPVKPELAQIEGWGRDVTRHLRSLTEERRSASASCALN